MSKQKEKEHFDAAVSEDPLIQDLLKAKGKEVEVIAFGICYTGKLASIDVDHGTIVIVDGEDRAMIEIERMESMVLLGSS